MLRLNVLHVNFSTKCIRLHCFEVESEGSEKDMMKASQLKLIHAGPEAKGIWFIVIWVSTAFKSILGIYGPKYQKWLTKTTLLL